MGAGIGARRDVTGPRTDPTSGDQTVLAPARAARTRDAATCPFCPGNEALTPPELARVPGEDGAWRVRVVPNRYPLAVRPHGCHEVVVESPDHDWDYPDATAADIAAVLGVIRERHRALRDHPAIITFRNRGAGAGASRPHPHLQTVALRDPPVRSRRMWDRAAAHRHRTGRSLYDDLLADALRHDRLVSGRESVAAFVPPAPVADYETWVVPRAGAAPDFAAATDAQLDDCARVLGRLVRAVAADAPYHLLLYCAPRTYRDFRWHLRLLPRLTTPGGFERSTGMSVTTVPPAAAAAELRATTEG